MRRIAALCAAAVALATSAATGSDPTHDPDTAEPGSVEAIAEATTDPKFLNPWVSYVPESSNVPSPTDFLGHWSRSFPRVYLADDYECAAPLLQSTGDHILIWVGALLKKIPPPDQLCYVFMPHTLLIYVDKKRQWGHNEERVGEACSLGPPQNTPSSRPTQATAPVRWKPRPSETEFSACRRPLIDPAGRTRDYISAAK